MSRSTSSATSEARGSARSAMSGRCLISRMMPAVAASARSTLGGRGGGGEVRPGRVEKRARELLAGLEPLLAVLGHRLVDDLHELLGDGRRGARLLEDVGVQDAGDRADERRVAVHQLVEDATER